MKRQRCFAAALGLSFVMAITSFWVAVPANAQKGGGANQIAVRQQDTNTGQIIVDSVAAAEDGWLVIYFGDKLDPLTIAGFAPVHKGVNTDVKVDVNRELVDPYPTLWAVLHVDKGVIGTFEWPGADTPVWEGGKPVMAAFGTQAAPVIAAAPQAPAPSAPKTLPVAGESARWPVGWLVLVGLGSLLVVLGLALSRTRARNL